jgi:hypothetical protein
VRWVLLAGVLTCGCSLVNPSSDFIGESRDAGEPGPDAGDDGDASRPPDAAVPVDGAPEDGGPDDRCTRFDYEGRGYHVCTGVRTGWDGASTFCRDLGADDLVVLNDELESLWHAARIQDVAPSPAMDWFWIGLSDVRTEGEFRWIDGSRPAWWAWRNLAVPGVIEVPLENNPENNCAHSRPGVDGDWYPEPCSSDRPFTCEGPMTGAPAIVRGMPSTCTKTAVSGYMVCTHTVNWLEARETCRDNGMDLLVIDSVAEQALFDGYLMAAPATPGAYWLGVSDIEREGNFSPVTGLTPTYENYGAPALRGDFAAGPSNGGVQVNCVEMRRADPRWFGVRCQVPHGFICEMP